MSLFNWFTKKPQGQKAAEPEDSSLGFGDATVPVMPSDRLRVKRATPPPSTSVSSQKNERIEHRELLYTVVHDVMNRAGFLAASYKFKVLSLDPRGLQYLIMMDLTSHALGDTGRLAEIETMIAQAAKARHTILVTAVYWRVNEQVTTGISRSQARPSIRPATPSRSTPAFEPAVGANTSVKQSLQFEPLQQEEVDAFKRALASGARPTAPVKVGHTVTSGRRNPAPADDFEDTQIVNSNDHVSPLSITQYGDLN